MITKTLICSTHSLIWSSKLSYGHNRPSYDHQSSHVIITRPQRIITCPHMIIKALIWSTQTLIWSHKLSYDYDMPWNHHQYSPINITCPHMITKALIWSSQTLIWSPKLFFDHHMPSHDHHMFSYDHLSSHIIMTCPKIIAKTHFAKSITMEALFKFQCDAILTGHVIMT